MTTGPKRPAPRSLLFVPGHRPDRFAKAIAAGADVVCIDLEDAVPPGAKAEARTAALDFARQREGGLPLWVRPNGLDTTDGLADWQALIAAGAPFAAIMLPKVRHPAELGVLRRAMDGIPALPDLVPLIETRDGLENAPALLQAPGVTGAVLGAVDLSAALGSTRSFEALLYARSRLVAAAAETGIDLFDSPHTDVADIDGLRTETERARALGFTARACIHPGQIAVVHEVYTPGAAEIAWAREVRQALAAAGGGAALLNGKLVEKPVMLAAERVLARAGEV